MLWEFLKNIVKEKELDTGKRKKYQYNCQQMRQNINLLSKR